MKAVTSSRRLSLRSVLARGSGTIVAQVWVIGLVRWKSMVSIVTGHTFGHTISSLALRRPISS